MTDVNIVQSGLKLSQHNAFPIVAIRNPNIMVLFRGLYGEKKVRCGRRWWVG